MSREMVKHPSHYTQFSQEVIVTINDWIKGYEDAQMGYYIGTILKYLARAPYKHDNPYEDLQKGFEYFTHLMKYIEGLNNKKEVGG